MAKYRSYEKKAPARLKEPHPVWRGIGCLTMIVVPAISLGIGAVLVEMAPALGIQFPAELLGPPMMPPFLFQVPGLRPLLYWIQGQNNLYAILVGAFVATVLLAGLMAFGYALIYRLVGPSRYSGYDAPPPNVKVRKYKR